MNERERNRRDFPEAAAFVDRMRAVFGDGVRLRWWIENEKTIGNVPAEVLRGIDGGANTKHQTGLPALSQHGPGVP
jgi:hypothetical protein